MRGASPEIVYLDEWAPSAWYWVGFLCALLLFATPCCCILGIYMIAVAVRGRGFVAVLEKWRCGDAQTAADDHIL